MKQVARRSWERNEEAKLGVMVATCAFGCRIDVGTVRAVIYASRPNYLVDFVQESGWAGRGGREALSLVLNTDGTVAAFDNVEDSVDGCT